MIDRPTLAELIDAARMHMETNVIPAVREDRKLYFRTLVAINVLKIAERELELGAGHSAAAWERLNAIEGVDTPAPKNENALRQALQERHMALCERIRAGDYDRGENQALFEHLKATTIAQLEIANPKYLQRIAAEDADPSLDAWQGR